MSSHLKSSDSYKSSSFESSYCGYCDIGEQVCRGLRKAPLRIVLPLIEALIFHVLVLVTTLPRNQSSSSAFMTSMSHFDALLTSGRLSRRLDLSSRHCWTLVNRVPLAADVHPVPGIKFVVDTAFEVRVRQHSRRCSTALA